MGWRGSLNRDSCEMSSRDSGLSEVYPPEVGLSLCGALACEEGGQVGRFAETGDVT